MTDQEAMMPIPVQPGRPPRRVQLSRRKGARKPAGAVVVARPSRWGNPVAIGTAGRSRAQVVALYRSGVLHGAPGYPTPAEIRASLAGRDLACWCPLNELCHADVLLAIANGSVD